MKKTNKPNRPNLLLFLVLVLGCLSGCFLSPQKLDYQKAKSALEKKDFKEAITYLDRVIRRDPEDPLSLVAAREAATVSSVNLEAFAQAIRFYRFIIQNTEDRSERLDSQERVATIFLDKLSKPQDAVVEFQRLLNSGPTVEKEKEYRLMLARAYLAQPNYYQSQQEIRNLLKMKLTPTEVFTAKLFLSNLFTSLKDFNKAIAIYKEMQQFDARLAQKHNVSLSLSSCYEELRDFPLAIRTLEEAKLTYPNPDFIDLKIKRLRERQENMPGAQGLKK